MIGSARRGDVQGQRGDSILGAVGESNASHRARQSLAINEDTGHGGQCQGTGGTGVDINTDDSCGQAGATGDGLADGEVDRLGLVVELDDAGRRGHREAEDVG